MKNNKKHAAQSGTNIDEVKQKNAESGMSYNEAKEYIAKTTGGHDTDFLSNTDAEAVKRKNNQSKNSNQN